jgi:hypothetical protein
MRGRILIAAGILALLASAEAGAATLAVEPEGKDEVVVYRAEPGEENRVTASTDGATVTLTDPGADIAPGAECASVNDHEATCNFPGFVDFVVELGGKADRLRIVGPQIILRADGGPGPDRLTGGPEPDSFDGGFGPDVISGRGHFDGVAYGDRTNDLRVTLAGGKRNDGGPLDGAKRDRLRGIERVSGGEGDDLLVGSSADNSLLGVGGRDVLKGKAGADRLVGSDGRDRAFGGPGPDLFSPSAGRDRHYGGKGPDTFQDGFNDGGDLQSGGLGFDTAQYQSGHNRITLDGRANDGNCANPACSSSDEGDNVTGIDELLMFGGDDFLVGSRHDELFQPAGGADTVQARGGDDTIIVSPDNELDTYNCGPGIDRIEGTADAFDTNPNCEVLVP